MTENPWIEWKGGECPVEPGSSVLIKTRDDYETTSPIRADSWRWHNDPDNHGGRFDIIAYRVVSS